MTSSASTPNGALMGSAWIRPFESLGIDDVPRVGGKNASLGEMIRALAPGGIRAPVGLATTADAYRAFLSHNDLDGRLVELLAALDDGSVTLENTGRQIRLRGSVMDVVRRVAALEEA